MKTGRVLPRGSAVDLPDLSLLVPDAEILHQSSEYPEFRPVTEITAVPSTDQ